MSDKTHSRYPMLKFTGDLMFHLGFAVASVGLIYYLLTSIGLLFLMSTTIGIVTSTSGYFINKYGKFNESAEQVAKGLT